MPEENDVCHLKGDHEDIQAVFGILCCAKVIIAFAFTNA